jgi:hypothetical protein
MQYFYGMAMIKMSELCRTLGRSPAYIRKIQAALKIPMHKDGTLPESIIPLIEKVLMLRAFSVPLEDIAELFRRERHVLESLRMDSLSTSSYWYLESCGQPSSEHQRERRLFLTDYDVGFDLAGGQVQAHLDFGRNQHELFTRAEMGDDSLRHIDRYFRQLDSVRDRVALEQTFLEQALLWARRHVLETPRASRPTPVSSGMMTTVGKFTAPNFSFLDRLTANEP